MAPSRKAAAKKAAAAQGNAAPAASAGGKAKFAKADWKEGFKKRQAGVSDMTLLSTISNDSINDNLQKRFENADIYTYIGHVLISVNPFRMLPIYDDATLHSYRNKNRLEMPPHVYSIAETMYYNMLAYKENQCVIISGESGAGKTEAAKKIMEYIAAVAGAGGGAGRGSLSKVKDMVLATNPLLESFGCAKTLRNNNSSRHGKYLEIEFNSQGSPVGAHITNYLLEKGRVVGQLKQERNFHIFYQFTKAASAAQREAFGIQEPSAYAYTANAGCLDVDGINDSHDWKDTLGAMATIGIPPDEQDSILRVLATILWLGNVNFVNNDEGNAGIEDEGVPNFVAYLMEADPAAVQKALTQRIMETARGIGRRGSVYEVPMNRNQAIAARDALAKSLYDHLFEWIVGRVNVAMKATQETELIIGVLDIYGFEIFQNNSFEQLCINYVNEKLQQIFIQLTLKTEQEEYVREQIKWTPIDYFNNKVVCDLIEEKRPPGVFAALNDACATAHADPTAADSSFVQRLSSLSSNQYFESRGDKYIIKHYAGDVTYNIAGMTDKNKDTLSKDLLDLVLSSPNAFLQKLFPERPDPDSKKRPPTAGDKIKTSANALVEKLMRSQPSYIRTIKPNQNKSPSEYDSKAILHQIKYLGLQENIRVRRAGFAYRNTFEKMVERFYLLSPNTSYAGDYTWQGDAKSGCQQILKDVGIAREEWQMGTTKAFIKTPETLFALEHMRDRYWHNMAGRIQRCFRSYLRRRYEAISLIQKFWMDKKINLELGQLRDYGHQVLGQRKERRRHSLSSMRLFQGDYLDVGSDSSPQGEMLRNACNIPRGETVVFSMPAQILVSKLGRSSVRSPRYLILTKQAVYIAITQLVQGRPSTTLERKIPLTTLNGVSMSTLKDDWIILNCAGMEEDPVMTCVFKTELLTHLMRQTNGSLQVVIAPQIEYKKKKDKKAAIKFVKDESLGDNDAYKSSTVSVASGEPASSLSKKREKQARTNGGYAQRAPAQPQAAAAPRNIPASRPMPGSSASAKQPPIAPPPPPSNNSRKPGPPPQKPVVPAAPAAVASITKPMPASIPIPMSAKPMTNGNAGRAPPPPPPAPARAPPPAAPQRDQYKCLFDFTAEQAGEINLTKGEIVELVKQEDTGWWLVKKPTGEGYAPSNYLELMSKAKAPSRAPPPPKPKPLGSGTSTPQQGSAMNGSRVSTNTASGGMDNNALAAALAQRLKNMS